MSDLTPVRDEDAFDIAKVHTWLKTYINQEELPQLQQFRSGASNHQLAPRLYQPTI
jgi:hypothetical protein